MLSPLAPDDGERITEKTNSEKQVPHNNTQDCNGHIGVVGFVLADGLPT
jgi:hypothetical protein